MILWVAFAGRRTAHNLALPAGGIRRPHPRLSSGGRGCGSAWSLYDRRPPCTPPDGMRFVIKMKKIFERNRNAIRIK